MPIPGKLRVLKCPHGIWEREIHVHSEQAAGHIFMCYDCALRDSGQCLSYRCSPLPDRSMSRVFDMIEFFEHEGLTRHEQGLALFAMGIRQNNGKPYCGDWISTFIWRKKHGRYIPPSFEHRFENDIDRLIDALARS